MAVFHNFSHQVAPQKNTKIFFKPSKLNRKAPSAYNGLPLASTMNHPFDESKHNIMVHYKNCACCFTISAVVKLTF